MQCKQGERGSALLIVFLFAAFVAIMLYKEMPVMAFEAQRAKEQLLVDRGEQYKQAVKVYWTHFQGRFPPDIKALENTNNIRFLRRRYKDPLTGKDDWRLLHMAPGGMGLMDSKVNPMPANPNQNGQNGQGGQSGFGSTNTSNSSVFGASAFAQGGSGGGQSASNNSNSISGPAGGSPGTYSGAASAANTGPVPNNVGGPPVYSVPQRPPAIPANGTPIANAGDANGDPNDPNNLYNANAGGNQNPGMAAFVNPQQQQNSEGAPMAVPGQSPNQSFPSQQSPNQQPNQPPNAVQQIYGMMANQSAPAQTGIGRSPGNQIPSTTTGSSTFGSNASMNTTLGGMFAGVASIAQGTGIKIIDDQHEYSKWEFWFNPQQYAAGGSGIANPQGTTNGTGSPAQSGPSNQQNGFGFGTGATQPSTQGFGQSQSQSMTGSAFNNNTAPATPSNPQPQQ